MTAPSRAARRELRAALRATAPWLDATDAGPRAVDAGQCARCDRAPRLLPTCGPTSWTALCRACAAEVGTDAWCDGHHDEAVDLLAWAAALPDWWRDAVVLWWVGTGEVAWDGTVPADAPRRVRTALLGAGGEVSSGAHGTERDTP